VRAVELIWLDDVRWLNHIASIVRMVAKMHKLK